MDYIMECGSLYDFDGSEAISRLGLCVGKKCSSSCSVDSKLSWSIPFNKECVNMYGCQGLKYNKGLFTQCKNEKEGESYCKSCLKECERSVRGIPENGCISDRMKWGLMEFRDPKGRKPTSFLSILKKNNISIEKVREEAKALSIMIDEEHLTEIVKEKKEKVVKEKKEKGEKRGRPKKAPKEVETNGVVDLFAELVEEAVANEVVGSEVIVEEKGKKDKVSGEEKELKKAAKEAKKEAEKQAREEKRAAEKAAKAAAKAEAKKEKKPANKDGKKEEKKAEEQVVKVEESKAKVTVTRFEHDGKKYLKSTENILYDPATKDEVGIWCEESKTIKALPEEDDEEIEEDEYESDDE